ncbi:MAG TPA: serine hydrolase domain-containing protein [Rhizomicrobium sp.]|jgi:CubicO group peptidase (beta-lactamase class C family)
MRIWAGVAAGVLLLGLGAAPAIAKTKPPASLGELDSQLAAAFRAAKIPGASVAIVENGKLVFARGYGTADAARKIPATADSVFRAGSISKSITSIAAMTLVEQHKLSLDARLAELAPEVKFVNPWEKTDPVRLVHLLEHTTGWPDISTRVLAMDGKGWSVLRGVEASSADFVSRWPPGRFAVYNNAGPSVAGVMIEKVSGETFNAYVDAHVLRSMGMATADFDLTPALRARLAKSYAPDGSETPFQYIVLPPAGSLNVSARELAQLVRFFLGRGTVDGRRILSPDSVARIERSESNLGARYGFTMGYGLGNAPFPEAGIIFRGHNGSIDSFTSLYGYLARCNCGYVLMANGGQGVDFATPVSTLVESYLTRGLKMALPPTVTVDDAELQRYAGLYRNITPPNALIRPYVEVLNLTRVSAGHGKLVVSGNDFLPTGAHIFRRFDREQPSLAFVEDGGQVYKISAFYSAEKEPLWRVALIAIEAVLLAAAAAIAIAMAPVWLIAGLRGRLSERGGWLVRFAPLLSIVALAVTFVLPLMAIMSSGTSAFRSLSDIGPYSLAIFAASILFPLFAALGLWLSLSRRDAGAFVRLYAGLASSALLAFAVYAAAIGWVGARTWTM